MVSNVHWSTRPFTSSESDTSPLGGLEIAEELGSSARTVVYRARRDGADYALKMLKAPVSYEQRESVAFRREAAMLASVSHPGLARIYEVGYAQSRPFIVTELVEGESIESLMASGAMEEARVAAIAVDVAGALATAHRAGLVHRDVKPANIMIRHDGRAKVIDFGLANWADVETGTSVAGSFVYMAPEQAGMLKRLVDGRSDLYALGVTLFRCLTGRLPFESRDVGELMRLHTVAAPPDIRAFRAEVSPVFAAIVAKLLAKDPDDRYQNGQGLVADLQRLRADGGEALFPLGLRDTPIVRAEARLVGREFELTELLTRWDAAREGKGGVALVSGPSGGGKTRLVREFLSAARTRDGDCLVLQGKSASDEVTPLAPIRSALEQYFAAVNRMPQPARGAMWERVRVAATPVAPLVATLTPALSELLGTSETYEGNQGGQFAGAVATFMIGLAQQAGAAILWLDDVQWLDSATRRVMRRLAEDLADSSLLVIATTRDQGEDQDGGDTFAADVERVIDTRLVLRPLNNAAAAELLAASLGGGALAPAFVGRLAARCGGNPLTVVEYLRAVIDAGLIGLSWGSWKLEERGLDALELSADVLSLILSRADDLGPESRRVLAIAAATGIKFRPDQLAVVCEMDEEQVLAVIRAAVDRGLVSAAEGGDYSFVHDRIREALLADVDEKSLRSWHQRIATMLQASPPAGPERVYAIARHYVLGETDRTPQGLFDACVAAGQLALAQQAPQEALEFLEAAGDSAARAAIDPGGSFHAALGQTYLRVGRFLDANEQLQLALATESRPNTRALLLGQIAEAHSARTETGEALAAARHGLAELGRPLPTNPLILMLSTLWLFVAAVLVHRLGFHTATGERRERYRLEYWLSGAATEPAAVSRQTLLWCCLCLRTLYPVNRIGLSPEYVRAYAQLAGALRYSRVHRSADRLFERMHRAAAELDDPTTVAYVAWNDVIIRSAARGVDLQSREMLGRLLTEHGRWLSAREQLGTAAQLCLQLNFCGYHRESLEWHDRVRAQVDEERARGHGFFTLAAVSHAILGYSEKAEQYLNVARTVIAENPHNVDFRFNYIAHAITVAFELSRPNDFETAVSEMRRHRVTPRRIWPSVRVMWVALAQARLAQCLSATDAQRRSRLAEARAAIDELRRAAGSFPFLRASHLIALAAYRHLTGDSQRALRDLRQAEHIAQGLDAPIVEYDIARIRARALRSVHLRAEADRQALHALRLATNHGWRNRAQWIRSEFSVEDPSSHGISLSISGELNRRRLDALQQVSLASATAIEPQELARVALDETLRILGADRAFLFLVDDESGTLLPQLGRDAAGSDLDTLTEYATSLVERVRTSEEPLVVTGDENGHIVGSESAAALGLLSIMVAPVRLKGELRGVVYLDSRLAKGIFTGDDVDILVAIVNQIAVSLETARAAQLDAAVRAAEQQRDLAEMLRSAMSTLGETLDPDEVLRILLATAARTARAEAACLLQRDEDALRVAVIHGRVDQAALGRTVDLAGDDTLVALTVDQTPIKGATAEGQPAPLPLIFSGVRSWIGVPLAQRTETMGYLLVGSITEHAYSDADVEIEAVLARQGMAAYETARLFAQIHVLATTDELTGLHNRRHLLAVVNERLALAQGQRPAALMIDIDYFKNINDSYGHSVGDEVIREVAARLLRGIVGDQDHADLVGRYGGEEFACFLLDGRNAADVAERLRHAIALAPVTTHSGPIYTTISVGATRLRPTERELEALLRRADNALYEAKRQGRNRVVMVT
jgi:diguanylate cyclase (GGDEF)-like protein